MGERGATHLGGVAVDGVGGKDDQRAVGHDGRGGEKGEDGGPGAEAECADGKGSAGEAAVVEGVGAEEQSVREEREERHGREGRRKERHEAELESEAFQQLGYRRGPRQCRVALRGGAGGRARGNAW